MSAWVQLFAKKGPSPSLRGTRRPFCLQRQWVSDSKNWEIPSVPAYRNCNCPAPQILNHLQKQCGFGHLGSCGLCTGEELPTGWVNTMQLSAWPALLSRRADGV